MAVLDKSLGIVPVCWSNKKPRFLIVLHKAGHWAFPKGHPDTGESVEETMRRELWEESGITNVKLDFGKTFVQRYAFERGGQRHQKIVEFVVGIVSEPIIDIPEQFRDEISEGRWTTYGEAKELLTFEESTVLLNEVLEYLKDKKA